MKEKQTFKQEKYSKKRYKNMTFHLKKNRIIYIKSISKISMKKSILKLLIDVNYLFDWWEKCVRCGVRVADLIVW